LANLLRDRGITDENAELGLSLGSYTNTLHQFYGAMEKVEKCDFKEAVEETISFINNVIEEEIKLTMRCRVPNKSLNGTFTFSNGSTFRDGSLSHLIGNGSLTESLEQHIENCMVSK
jgi:hypothetical protein